MGYDLHCYIGDNEKKNRLKIISGLAYVMKGAVSTSVAFTIEYFDKWTEGLPTKKKSSWKIIHLKSFLNLLCHKAQTR